VKVSTETRRGWQLGWSGTRWLNVMFDAGEAGKGGEVKKGEAEFAA
jgi:hypothetical protein